MSQMNLNKFLYKTTFSVQLPYFATESLYNQIYLMNIVFPLIFKSMKSKQADGQIDMCLLYTRKGYYKIKIKQL